MTAAVELRPADDVAGLGGERADGYVGGEDRHGGRHGGALLGHPHGRVVEPLVVGVGGRAGGGGEPVDADVGQDPVAVHGVLGQQGGRVGPLLELLHDPGEQPGGGVGQRLPDGLRPGALDLHVRAGLLLPLLHRGQPGALGPGQRGHLGRVTGREGDQRVDVHADDPAGSYPADERADEGAHVPTLHAVALVAEPVHQLGERGGGAAVRPAGLGQRTGESVARQRRDDQMEGVGGVAAVRRRVGERADHVEELHDRARPAVQEQQRGGVRLGGAQVQELHAGSVDRGDELGEGVERRLVSPPVVLGSPVGGELT